MGSDRGDFYSIRRIREERKNLFSSPYSSKGRKGIRLSKGGKDGEKEGGLHQKKKKPPK